MLNKCKLCGNKLGKHWYRMTLEPMSFKDDYRYTVVADICNDCYDKVLKREESKNDMQ